MISTAAQSLARSFRRVRYSYHQEFFEHLGEPDVAALFGDIWALCAGHTDDTHPHHVGNQSAVHWAKLIKINPDVRATFLETLIEVIKGEAVADEGRGRTVLASKLRAAAAQIESSL